MGPRVPSSFEIHEEPPGGIFSKLLLFGHGLEVPFRVSIEGVSGNLPDDGEGNRRENPGANDLCKLELPQGPHGLPVLAPALTVCALLGDAPISAAVVEDFSMVRGDDEPEAGWFGGGAPAHGGKGRATGPKALDCLPW